MSTVVRFDRLEKLATYVEMGGPPGHSFDMAHWGNAQLATRAHCGTAGCMMGLATLLWPNEISIDYSARGVGSVRHRHCAEARSRWEERTYTGLNAAVMLFGIEFEEAYKLFNFGGGPDDERHRTDNKHHARRLREFISAKRRQLGIEE